MQVHVSRIHVAGLQRTKNDIVVEQVKDILHATSLQDLLMRSLEALQKLQELNTFKHVDIQLDTVKGEGGRREGVEVMFVVEEYGWLASTIAANAGTQSGDAVRECVCVGGGVSDDSVPLHPPRVSLCPCVTCLVVQSSSE